MKNLFPLAGAVLALASCALLSPTPTASPTPAGTATPKATPTPLSLAADVCGDLASGPNESVTAAAATGSAPVLKGEHTRNIVTVPASGSAKAGYVKFDSTKEGQWDLFFTKDVPVKVTDAVGKAVTISATTKTFPDCAQLGAQHTVNLKVGIHYLELGPTADSEVSIVLEGGEEE